MIKKRPGWRDYQARLKKRESIHRWKSRIPVCISLVLILLFTTHTLFALFDATPSDHFLISPDNMEHTALDNRTRKVSTRLEKTQVQNLLTRELLLNTKVNTFNIPFKGRNFRVETTINTGLQQYLAKKIDRSIAVSLGLIAMDPESGRILAMVGFDRQECMVNPCTESNFPAASVFKIITAAAAIEKLGLIPDSRLKFNGRKHTLYKSQLKEKTNRYTNRITLKDSFAQSVNPVFGKLGSNRLGKSVLEWYAEAFAFNREIGFELPVSPSTVTVSEKPYHLAEIASGFNRETMISPLHGVLLTSAILNHGTMAEPTIIQRIVDEQGNTVYQGSQSVISRPVRPETALVLKQLMNATVRYGTARKAFRGCRRDRILGKLNLGGKTGSIANRAHDVHYDWFVGFAEEKQGPEKIAVAVVVGHGDKLGTRAGQYARMAFRHYFLDIFNRKKIQMVKAECPS